MNAAAVFVVAGRAKDFKQGVEQARQTILSGQASAKLQQLAAVSHRLGQGPAA
jgi:anthranilate phosphoribosyltransferase